jgi:hypothetical protein
VKLSYHRIHDVCYPAKESNCCYSMQLLEYTQLARLTTPLCYMKKLQCKRLIKNEYK